MQQMTLQLIQHHHADIVIPQRATDGYINATALCQAAGKKWNHYWSAVTAHRRSSRNWRSKPEFRHRS